mgnify:CR=1 FL=1
MSYINIPCWICIIIIIIIVTAVVKKKRNLFSWIAKYPKLIYLAAVGAFGLGVSAGNSDFSGGITGVAYIAWVVVAIVVVAVIVVTESELADGTKKEEKPKDKDGGPDEGPDGGPSPQ